MINNFTFYVVISEPDDVTVCEGRSTTFTCVLDGSISSGDVQWYRLLKDTGTTKRIGRFTVDPIGGQNSFATRLYIINARRSRTGYYWVKLPSDDVCNVSLTVATSKQLRTSIYMDVFIYNT